MSNQTLFQQLCDKVSKEQDAYREKLLSKRPVDILNCAYEYTVRQELVYAIETCDDMTKQEISALLQLPNVLSTIYWEFIKTETGETAFFADFIKNIANTAANEAEESGHFTMNQNFSANGWLSDVMDCVDQLPSIEFSLDDMYSFEAILQAKHPMNRNVKAKIRQQLQLLRDKGLIEFEGNGSYKKRL